MKVTLSLGGLAVLGALPTLTMSGPVPTYVAVFPPGGDARMAVARLAQAGAGWRVLRVVISGPTPILILAHQAGGGPWPAALLLPVPSVPACNVISRER